MTNPAWDDAPENTTDTEVFDGGAGAAPSPRYILPSWRRRKALAPSGVIELISSVTAESQTARPPTSVVETSRTSDPGKLLVYPGLVAETAAISSARSVAGGVGWRPAGVRTMGRSATLSSNRYCRQLCPLLGGDGDEVRRRPPRLLGNDQAGEERRELALGLGHVVVREDLLDDRRVGRDAVVGIERGLPEVQLEALDQGRHVDVVVEASGVGVNLYPRAALAVYLFYATVGP